MKLYYSPGACSLAPHILMNEWNISYTLEKVDLKTHKTSDGGDYYAINPKGYVPALMLDNGYIMTENISILVYISDRKNGGKVNQYEFLEWLAFISTELHKGIGSLFGYKNGPADVVAGIKEKIAKRLKIADRHLSANEYVLGHELSGADAYLVTVLRWCNLFQIGLKVYPNIDDYFQRMQGRPSVQNALKEEGLLP